MISTLSKTDIKNSNANRRQANTDLKTKSSNTNIDGRFMQSKEFVIKSQPSSGREHQRCGSTDNDGLMNFYIGNEKKFQNKIISNHDLHFKHLQGYLENEVTGFCNEFQEMQKATTSLHSSNLTIPHTNQPCGRGLKQAQEIHISNGTENIFDENFDLDDIILPQSGASSFHSPNSFLHEVSFNPNYTFSDHLHSDEDHSSSQIVQPQVNGFHDEYSNINIPGASNNSVIDYRNNFSTTNMTDGFQNINNSQSYGDADHDVFHENMDTSTSKRLSGFSPSGNFAFDGKEYEFRNSTDSLTSNNYPSTNYEISNRVDVNLLPSKQSNDGNNNIFLSNHFFSPDMSPNMPELKTNAEVKRDFEIHKRSVAAANWQQTGIEIQEINCGVGNEVDRFPATSKPRTGNRDNSTRGTVATKKKKVHSIQSSSKSSNGESKNSSRKTAYNEKWGVKVFKAWCVLNDVRPDFENLSAEELNRALTKFWQSIRKANGDYYGRNSLFNLRAMINKYLKSKTGCATFDIVTDERFRTSNECLDEQLKHLKGMGRKIDHKQPISADDIQKLYESKVFGLSTPISLLRKVWFEITLHFCLKGGESQEKIEKTTFQVFTDEGGRRYVARASSANMDQGKAEAPRMYETVGSLCPVKSFELYLSKLHPGQRRLFQQPRKKTNANTPWYGKSPIGEKALQQMMSSISNDANLSKRYTNHCVRTTALQQFTTMRKNYEALETSTGEQFASGSSGYQDQRVCVTYNRQPQLGQTDEYSTSLNGFSNDLNCEASPPTAAVNYFATSAYNQPQANISHYTHTGNNQMRRPSQAIVINRGFFPSFDKPIQCLEKKSNVFDTSLIRPPPSYNEHRIEKMNSISAKRIRRNEHGVVYYQAEVEGVPQIAAHMGSENMNSFVINNGQQSSHYLQPPPPYNHFSHRPGGTSEDLALPPPSPMQISNSAKSTNLVSEKKIIKSEHDHSEAISNGLPFELVDSCNEF